MELKQFYFTFRYKDDLDKLAVKAETREKAREWAEEWAAKKDIDIEIIS